MKSSHCICPSFLSKNIGNDSTFFEIFIGKLLMSDDQIVLDKEEHLATSYIKSLGQDTVALKNYISWKKMLDSRSDGKTLISSSSNPSSTEDAVYNTISKAITTFAKTILTDDNNHYTKFIQQINRQRIQLYNLNNLSTLNISPIKKSPTYPDLEDDLEWVLQRLGRRAEKENSEDYNNDYLRDMLASKLYEIKDQTREGSSSTNLGAGELDLVIEHQGTLFSLIEAMKLTSIDKGYINKHYLKLLQNYNPLEVKRTFLISYYTGANFNEWWKKYKNHIQNLNMSKFAHPDYSSESSVADHATQFGSIKKLHHHLEINGEHSLCTHFAIRLGR